MRFPPPTLPVVHCATERQAREVLAALEQRMAEVGLQLHPDKTTIVYCKDGKRRRRDCAETSFTFLGYTFRARNALNRSGTSMFTGFLPAVSKDALKRMSEEVRSWRIHLRTATELQDLAAWINPIVRGSPGVGELLPVRGVQGSVQRGRLPCVEPADALDTGQVRGQAPARDERTPPSLL